MPDTNTASPPPRCLSVDLEVSKQTGRIHAFAAVRSDTGHCIVFDAEGDNFDRVLAEADTLAEGADCVLGHNLINFDLPHLQKTHPRLRLLELPALDTLWLNPLAFPRNPYHRLVKHYQDGQLKHDRRNDPELDARLALSVFARQHEQLRREAPPELLTAWHWLTTCTQEAGFDLFFRWLRGAPRPEVPQARSAIQRCLAEQACHTQIRAVTADAVEHSWGLAYALAFVSVAGGNSVMPPWVRHQCPEAGRLVRQLRDTACNDESCGWCREHHDATEELNRLFGFPAFRPEPVDPETQRPLQQVIVEAVMRGQNTLAILPTGTGKSLCYQIPALSRHAKTGALTVVISPLVALMADQVAGLERHGISSCVTANGLLSMPERAEALTRVRLGDAAILLISPEQLRSVSVRNAIRQREIGSWVLDEAHCLSKWGHDFRPDYRYVGRFIRETAGTQRTPPVLCLTATAKPEVKDEICDYFQQHLGIDMGVFDGGSRRTNLQFDVIQTSETGKHAEIWAQLTEHLPATTPGGAIIYCATRRHTETVAEFLRSKGIEAAHFHAGLKPEAKQNTQQRFISGELRAIAATNAFGMGIDKPDVRLVVHADIPSSLENYLQEAGRAGRDQRQARCVLLYTPNDVERQFGMTARSRLTRREIHGVLRALRALHYRQRGRDEVVASAGEILAEDEADDFQRDSATDDTRVRTAVAWLEEAALLTREENRVRVFPSSLLVDSVQAANTKLAAAAISDSSYRQALGSIAETLINADADEGISTDTLMEVSRLTPTQVRTALHDLEQFGVARNDTELTAFIHYGVRRPSRKRLQEAAESETRLIEWMSEAAPDTAKGDSVPLNLRAAAQRLKDDGFPDVRAEHVTRILHGMASDGRDEGGTGSLTIRKQDAETVRVTLNRDWASIRGMTERRRSAAELLMEHLHNQRDPDSRGNDLLVRTSLSKLHQTVEASETLPAETASTRKLMERALLWMHEQEAIRLNRGLTVFRPAMTIALKTDTRGFRQTDFEELQDHYDRVVRQIHVMAEFAERGLEDVAEALGLSLAYFTLGEDEFLRTWLSKRRGELARETTQQSWEAIVETLNNPTQQALVTDDRETTNMLVLAGPGSGKTRVLVHRIAYLVRAKRQRPSSILALAYNRHAAAEIRSRLAKLIGDDARGVVVLTCDALALRLAGVSLSTKLTGSSDTDITETLKQVKQQATALLQGDDLDDEEDAEEARARLLRGFRWILVDEYQDIGEAEYNLISALAGRTVSDVDTRLTLFAVGDDDQNIYTFNGSSVEFIRRFEQDYNARTAYLIDNYRSTGHIIDASNTVIAPADQRMKTSQPIRIDPHRAQNPPGGRWKTLDQHGRGRVQILPTHDSTIAQAQAAVSELQRLASLDSGWDWARCAIIGRTWSDLDPVRAVCEQARIPTQAANEDRLSVWHLRETQALVTQARQHHPGLIHPPDLQTWLDQLRPTPWTALLRQAVTDHHLDTGTAGVPAASFTEWLAEWCRDTRRSQNGLLLLTAHRAKGLEFDHVVVLDGRWEHPGPKEDDDAPRRLYYVAMTRAQQTLTLLRRGDSHPFLDELTPAASVVCRERAAPPPATPELSRCYRRLSLKDVYLGFAGHNPPDHRLHTTIAGLSAGDSLQAQQQGGKWKLRTNSGTVVGTLASRFKAPDDMRCVQATVAAVACWSKDRSKPEYQARCRCDSWEVVVPDLVFERS